VASIKVYDDDDNEIGQCSDYVVESRNTQETFVANSNRLPPSSEIKLKLQGWKTPVVPMPPPMEPQERKTANAMIGLLAWMLGGKVEVNMKDVLAVMDEKIVHQLRHPDGDPDKIFIEVEDK